MPSTFSFRAECRNDVGVFLNMLTASKIAVLAADIHTTNNAIAFPDVLVEISTSEASVEQLVMAARRIEDLHVIEQTLRPVPLFDNSLERDTRIVA